jgi:DNA-binding XRE family transcriptional regulator
VGNWKMKILWVRKVVKYMKILTEEKRMFDKENFAKELKIYRLENKLTKKAMTKRIGGISFETYLKWEEGNTEPKPENLEKVRRFVKI